MSQLEKIRNSFLIKGYREKELIGQHQFLELLNDLKGREFDEEVAMEIWQQASTNSHNETTVEELCSIILEAQNILMEKLEQVEDNIQKCRQDKRDIQIGNMSPQQRAAQLQRVNQDIQQLTKDKIEYEQDLILVTQPFGIDIKSFRDNQRPTGLSRRGQPAKREQNTELQHLFYVVIIMTLIQVIVIYKKYDFLNLLVLVTAMSIFVLNYFDSTYLKLSTGLAGISIAADFTWLIMYGGSYWSLPALSQHNSADSGYLKFIVLLTLINIAAKIYLVYLIVKINLAGVNNDFTINPFEGVTLDIKVNNDNLITQACRGGAGGFL